MRTFAEKIINNIEFDGLDLEHPYYDLGGGNRNEILHSSRVNADADVFIDIDVVISELTMLKKEGADKVYIQYHTDHKGYIFSGIQLLEI